MATSDRTRHWLAVGALALGALGLSIGVGHLAGWIGPTASPTTYAVAAFPPLFGLALFVFRREPSAAFHSDSVETFWDQRATVGAFTDLMLVLALSTGATHLLGYPPAPIWLLLLIGAADHLIRLVLIERKES